MKQQICLIVCFLSIFSLMKGQSSRQYDYDEAGNRVLRTVFVLSAPNSSPKQQKSNDLPPDTEESDELGIVYVDKVGDIALKIFPNPTTSVVELQIEGEHGEIEGTVTFYNLSGAKIGEQRITSYRTEIDMSSYSVGTYLATVVINGKKNYWKVVKQ